MIASILTDLGYGDSGKGSTVDYLCRTLPGKKIVVRLQGGHQVGHTVMHEGKIHEFRNFGSGVFQKVPTWYGPETTCCPLTFMIEYETLKEFNPTNIYHPNVLITTSYDIMFNRWQEDQRGDNRHGSVGMGFNATITRHEKCKFTVGSLLGYEYIIRMKLDSVRQYYINLGVPKSVFANIDVEHELTSISKFKDLIGILHDDIFVLNNFDRIIFEANQGILLDQNYGMFPHVTRSTTTCKPPLDFLNYLITTYPVINDLTSIEMVDISRIYHTRHGAGQFDVYPIKLKNTENEANHFNDFQKEFKTSKLDLRLLHYAIKINCLERLSHPLNGFISVHETIFTCLDQIESEDIEFIDFDGTETTKNISEFAEMVWKQYPDEIDNYILTSNNPKMELTKIEI